ncbi:early activation antigen CD69 [Limanda limanda]|uniref:early activation antigen CD69 n=1 Tax=Limanda limanda TaxID=27771 RepID=UPI0029C8FF62|nr:early activation antigen CD69 [Limanda limanda]
MYIKFCRIYGGDKKDDAKENLSSQLSVELEGERGKQTEGNARLYRAGCLFLTLICLVLLLAVIFLSVKLQTGSKDCPGRGEAVAGRASTSLTATCNYDQCQTDFPNIHHQKHDCHQCGNGWLPFEKSCYYLSTVRMTWSMSKNNCTARGGRLAIISSQNVQTFLTGKGNGLFWIGLRRTGNQWTWVDTSALGDSYWEDNQSDGDCGLLRGASSPQKNWMTSPCAHSSYFICEKTA